MKQTNTIFKQAQMEIAGNTIRCQNHTAQMMNISRIWTGKGPEEEFPPDIILAILLVNMAGIYFRGGFFALILLLGSMAILAWKHMASVKDGLHIKLCSGDVYSFLSDNKYFVNQAYSLLNEIIVKRNDLAHYSIIFSGNGEIVDHLAVLLKEAKAQEEAAEEENKKKKAEKKKAIEKVERPKTAYGLNDRLISELQTLYSACSEKEDMNEEILLLIEETETQVTSNDLTNMNDLYKKFIESGLINKCNDLGLNVLLGEIKKHIFG